MNERIWQLQGQAKVLAEEIVSQRKYDDYMEYKQSLMDQTMNKFAELIIAECARIGELKEQGYKDYDPEMSVGWYMKQHFGVEE